MEINFKDTATLSKKQVNNLLSRKEAQNKIFDLAYSKSDILIDEASSLISDYATCKQLHQHMVAMGVNSKEYVKMLKSQSYIKTAIAYAEIDKDYINIAKELIGFYGDIETEFIADSICYICTTYRSYETIESILYIVAEYGYIFNDSQLKSLQSGAHPHLRVDILDQFYGYRKSIRSENYDNATETKDKQ